MFTAEALLEEQGSFTKFMVSILTLLTHSLDPA